MRCIVCDRELDVDDEGDVCDECQDAEWLLVDDLGAGDDGPD